MSSEIEDPITELKALLGDMRSYPVQSWMCGWLQRIIEKLEKDKEPTLSQLSRTVIPDLFKSTDTP